MASERLHTEPDLDRLQVALGMTSGDVFACREITFDGSRCGETIDLRKGVHPILTAILHKSASTSGQLDHMRRLKDCLQCPQFHKHGWASPPEFTLQVLDRRFDKWQQSQTARASTNLTVEKSATIGKKDDSGTDEAKATSVALESNTSHKASGNNGHSEEDEGKPSDKKYILQLDDCENKHCEEQNSKSDKINEGEGEELSNSMKSGSDNGLQNAPVQFFPSPAVDDNAPTTPSQSLKADFKFDFNFSGGATSLGGVYSIPPSASSTRQPLIFSPNEKLLDSSTSKTPDGGESEIAYIQQQFNQLLRPSPSTQRPLQSGLDSSFIPREPNKSVPPEISNGIEKETSSAESKERNSYVAIDEEEDEETLEAGDKSSSKNKAAGNTLSELSFISPIIEPDAKRRFLGRSPQPSPLQQDPMGSTIVDSMRIISNPLSSLLRTMRSPLKSLDLIPGYVYAYTDKSVPGHIHITCVNDNSGTPKGKHVVLRPVGPHKDLHLWKRLKNRESDCMADITFKFAVYMPCACFTMKLLIELTLGKEECSVTCVKPKCNLTHYGWFDVKPEKAQELAMLWSEFSALIPYNKKGYLGDTWDDFTFSKYSQIGEDTDVGKWVEGPWKDFISKQATIAKNNVAELEAENKKSQEDETAMLLERYNLELQQNQLMQEHNLLKQEETKLRLEKMEIDMEQLQKHRKDIRQQLDGMPFL